MIRWGILGAGNIAHRFAASLEHVDDAELVAVSRRSEQKAREFLAEVPCAVDARAYGDHEALLADPAVDAVYISLPHEFHHAWSLAAIAAGKAVLCEKPAMLTADEMREVASASRSAGVLFMEAMKTRFVPAHEEVLRAVEHIGPVESVVATMCGNSLAKYIENGCCLLGGGPGSGVLLDCGIYCASWIDELLPGDIEVTGATCERYRDGSDVYCDAELLIGGVRAELECACDRAKPRVLRIEGARGTLVAPSPHRPERIELELSDGEARVIEAPYVVDDFYGQITHFCELLRRGAVESPVMPHAASIRCAEILDAIRIAMG